MRLIMLAATALALTACGETAEKPPPEADRAAVDDIKRILSDRTDGEKPDGKAWRQIIKVAKACVKIAEERADPDSRLEDDVPQTQQELDYCTAAREFVGERRGAAYLYQSTLVR